MTVTLEVSYAECKRLNRRYGTTYYWSTMVLPSVKRPHVHALYGFCRHADDIVDATGDVGVECRGAALAELRDRFFNDLERGRSDDLVLKAVVHTVRAFDIDPEGFSRFLHSMEMDLTVERYETWEDLRRYMDGSAAVIGEMMLPILEPSDLSAATGPARALGEAFQLTNFLRDVDEDLDRGRQYLPQEDLRRFGVELTARRCTPSFIELMRFEIGRCRELYRRAEVGIPLLPDRSARCIRAAHDLYGRILDRIEAQGYDVFAGRAHVSTPRKLAVAARHLTGRVPA
jgi:15-cis-phytoene synthase